MSDLGRRALSGLAKFQIALAVMIFLPAWSLAYCQGWLYWLLFGACLLTITLYFLRHDPSLVARCIRAGPTVSRAQLAGLRGLYAQGAGAAGAGRVVMLGKRGIPIRVFRHADQRRHRHRTEGSA